MTLSKAAASGDRLKTLIELRDDLAARLEVCQSDQNYTTLGRLFVDVLAQIAEMKGEKPDVGGALDELAAKRAANGRPIATAASGASRKRK